MLHYKYNQEQTEFIMSKQTNIQIGDHYQGDDWLCRVTKMEGIFGQSYGKIRAVSVLIRTEITFTVIEDPSIQCVRFSSDLNQFYKVNKVSLSA